MYDIKALVLRIKDHTRFRNAQGHRCEFFLFLVLVFILPSYSHHTCFVTPAFAAFLQFSLPHYWFITLSFRSSLLPGIVRRVSGMNQECV